MLRCIAANCNTVHIQYLTLRSFIFTLETQAFICILDTLETQRSPVYEILERRELGDIQWDEVDGVRRDAAVDETLAMQVEQRVGDLTQE